MRGPTSSTPASAVTPPVMWTTEEPAKSTTPCPRPKSAPSEPSQPPPQTQFAKSGYRIIDMKRP